ncbi:MAG: hypothetical protein UHS49_02145 [Faecalimonas sp.]|nr:hypothetical protein [Faecalimonas sp.]
MKITGKHILYILAIVSLIAFAFLLVWKVFFDGDIPAESLWVLGAMELVILSVCVRMKKTSLDI